MSLHARARAELGAWTPAGAAQETLRQDYLALLDTRPDAVWRSCAPAHLTASGVVLDPTGQHTLLVLHGKINIWVQPGGHCEAADETLAAAALREVWEETGVTGVARLPGPLLLSRHRAPCGDGQTHYDVEYLVVAAHGTDLVASTESHDVRWFDVSRLPTDLADGVATSVAAGVDVVRSPQGTRTVPR